MHLAKLTVVALLLAGPALAEMQDQWRPADCASVDAGSLEAELLDCDPALLLAAAPAEAAGEPEAAPAQAPATLAEAASAPLDLSVLGAGQEW